MCYDRIEGTIGLKKPDVLAFARNGVSMRFVLPLLALCALSSAPLRADMFNIRFLSGSGDPLPGSSGTLTTDGTCYECLPGAGLLDLTINIDRDSGTDAFDISDDVLGFVEWIPLRGLFFYSATNSETGDSLNMATSFLHLNQGGTEIDAIYQITPAAAAPEPSSLFLLMPIAAIVGLRWRPQRALRGA